MVQGAGFEPAKPKVADLQSAVFDRSTTPAYDVKFGAIANGVKIFNKKNSMFRPKIIGGIEEKFFSQLLKDFFKLKR